MQQYWGTPVALPGLLLGNASSLTFLANNRAFVYYLRKHISTSETAFCYELADPIEEEKRRTLIIPPPMILRAQKGPG
jgi:hypothetical protein